MNFKALKNRLQLFNECKILFLLLILIFAVSLLGQYSVTGNWTPALHKHLMRMIFSIGMMFIICCVDFKFWMNFAYVIYTFSTFALIIVSIMGTLRLGAQRWINLYFFTFQPSEIMKLALILVLARYYSLLSYQEIKTVKKHLLPLLFIMVPVFLVLKQPDLGTAGVLFAVGIAMVFLSGFPARIFGFSVLLSIVICPLGWFFLHDYQKNRILTFINPDSDPSGTGYHILQSKIAIGSGGFWGKGFLQGTQSKLDFLPEKNTDFIFTTISEEFGFVGVVVIVCLLVALSLYCFWVGSLLRNYFSKLLCYGFGLLLFIHTFINIAMVMGLIPVVGIPLPFLSYGGSSMISFMIGCGLVISAALYKNHTNTMKSCGF